MSSMAMVGSGLQSMRTRSRKGVETGGSLVVLAVESVTAAVTDIVQRRFSWTEFMLQAWFMTRVSLLPTILVAISQATPAARQIWTMRHEAKRRSEKRSSKSDLTDQLFHRRGSGGGT